jgi:hypothetical protein
VPCFRDQSARTDEDSTSWACLASIALVFPELAGHYLGWETALAGWQMTESQVVNRWMEKARLEETRENLLRLLRKSF